MSRQLGCVQVVIMMIMMIMMMMISPVCRGGAERLVPLPGVPRHRPDPRLRGGGDGRRAVQHLHPGVSQPALSGATHMSSSENVPNLKF